MASVHPLAPFSPLALWRWFHSVVRAETQEVWRLLCCVPFDQGKGWLQPVGEQLHSAEKSIGLF